jgi:hypothetical protein
LFQDEGVTSSALEDDNDYTDDNYNDYVKISKAKLSPVTDRRGL